MRDFLKGLRERGYHDLAVEYIDRLRKDPSTPAEMKAILEYEEGKGLLEEAATMGDLEKRLVYLDKARGKLASFAEKNPNNPLAPEALMQMARLLVERGHTAVLQANERKGAEAQEKLAEARSAFASARDAYNKAGARLKAAVDAFPKFIPEDDPRRKASEQARVDYMNCLLQRALVDYEDAQTYRRRRRPARLKALTEAQAAFNQIYKDYRLQLAGIYARMWEAKCMEEKGELGPAMGIYKELMDHSAVELRPLQAKVQFYQIIVDSKRGDFPLAVDRSADWLKNYPGQARTEDGLGVQLQLAKNILAQIPELTERDRDEAIRKATDFLSEVVRTYSPYKAEAVALLQKYKPRAAANLNQIGALSYDDAKAQGDSSIATHEWDRALLYFKQAVRKAEAAKDQDKVNLARYFMAYCYFQSKRYYEADVIIEHLARNYPQGGLSAKGTDIGMAALTLAYNEFSQIDRASDLNRLIALAKYTAQTWPDTDQADEARNTLGEIAIGQGRNEDAAASFESIRESSHLRNDGLVRAGDARWRASLIFRNEGKTKEADEQAKKALEETRKALDVRKAAGAGPTDPGFVTNAVALAEIHRASDRPKEAVALLAPIASAINAGPKSAETAAQSSKVLTTLLRSHIANGDSAPAILDMKALEAVSTDPQALTQLFFELGRSLKKEMDDLEARGKTAELQRTTQAYQQFLDALAGSKSGQSYQSLEWAGESMLSLGKAKEAVAVFDRVLETAGKDPSFLGPPTEQPDKLIRVKLKKSEALRRSKSFSDAETLLEEVKKERPRTLEVLMERGYLLEDWAQADATRWKDDLNYWVWLSGQLGRGERRTPQYFESEYHVALARYKSGDKTKAIQTLRGVMTLYPKVGSPEIKAKYTALLKQMGVG